MMGGDWELVFRGLDEQPDLVTTAPQTMLLQCIYTSMHVKRIASIGTNGTLGSNQALGN